MVPPSLYCRFPDIFSKHTLSRLIQLMVLELLVSSVKLQSLHTAQP